MLLVQASKSPILEAIHRKDKQVTEGSRTQRPAGNPDTLPKDAKERELE